MYTYSGTGYCVPMGQAEIDAFLRAYNDITDSSVDDIYDIDDMMTLGDWCSVDNVDSAIVRGKRIECGLGVLVLRERSGDPELFEKICSTAGIGLEQYHGSFAVDCWQ